MSDYNSYFNEGDNMGGGNMTENGGLSEYELSKKAFEDSIKEYPDEVTSFDELEIDEALLRGIYSMGFEYPSAIQRKAIVPMLGTNDLIAQAQSGTGKTATFLISAINKIDLAIDKPQIIVVCPNRELAQQIYFNYQGLNTFYKSKGTLVMGGTLVEDNFKELDKGAQFIIGTPGRIYDMMKRYVLRTDSLKCFIMDEADEMLSRGFKDQIYEIFQFIPKQCQICIFSATMPQGALELTEKFMQEPTRILVKAEEVTLEGIKQYYLGVQAENWKTATLYDLYERLKIKQTIIFTNSKRKAEWLKEQLEKEKFTVSCIHSALTQVQRDKTMKSFRIGNSRILIATDVIARGIDIQQVEIVINFDIPKQIETYIHRIGRSGRFGRKGYAINFVTEREFGQLERIQRYYSTQIDPLPADIKELI